jgi:hypothetical protein
MPNPPFLAAFFLRFVAFFPFFAAFFADFFAFFFAAFFAMLSPRIELPVIKPPLTGEKSKLPWFPQVPDLESRFDC